MPEMVNIGPVSELPVGGSKVYTIGDQDVAVFNIDGKLYAIDDRCPHSGASLGMGTLDGSTVTCPWHGWKFYLPNGECVGRSCAPLRQFPVTIAGDNLLVEITPSPEDDLEFDAAEAPAYLVRYGAMGWVARFTSTERVDCAHGDRVVIKTLRGMEIGEVLAVAQNDLGTADRHASTRREPSSGELLQLLTRDEERLHRNASSQSTMLLEKCQKMIAERHISVEAIDCELLFDGKTVFIYYLGTPLMELDNLAAELSAAQGTRCIFHPIIEAVAEPGGAGCGSGGCGSGGCGTGH